MGLKIIVFLGIFLAINSTALPDAILLPTPVPTPELSSSTLDSTTVGQLISSTTVSSSTGENSILPKERDDQKQPRAMNMTHPNIVNNNNATSLDLSDVNMDGEDMDLEFSGDKRNTSTVFGETRVLNKPHLVASEKSFEPEVKDVIDSSCVHSGKIYRIGEKSERGCDEVCTCVRGGRFECEPRCQGPFFRRGRIVDDPLCSEKPVDDPCCAIMICAADTENSNCIHENKTYSIGETFYEGCQKTCKCESAGNVTCKPRCPVLEQRDDCVNIKDSNDSCCMLQLCDVTQDIDEGVVSKSKETSEKGNANDVDSLPQMNNANTTTSAKDSSKDTSRASTEEPIVSVFRISNGTVRVLFNRENTTGNPIHLEISKDNGVTWTSVVPKNGIIKDLRDGHEYVIKSKETGKPYRISLPKVDVEVTTKIPESGDGCMYKGKRRSLDEEFHMGCDELCICGPDGLVECAPLQCPSTVGLDVLDPTCVRWTTDPPDFVPTYPMCCPPAMKCISNGSCVYKEQMFPNWSEIPISVSGCEQRCFCEGGIVECQSVCAPLPALPPPHLHCHLPSRPALEHLPDDDCCKEWACASGSENGTNKNLTDFDKDILRHFYGQNNNTNNNKNNRVQSAIFVTPPPSDGSLKPSKDVGGADKKHNKSNLPSDGSKKDSNVISQLGKPDKNTNVYNKHYEYPGPYADPNHSPQPPMNGLGPFPFVKKHKDKQIYSYDSEDGEGNSSSNGNDVGVKPQKPLPDHNKHLKAPSNHEEFPINDPYLSGSPMRVPFNQNGPGPGYFNPATTKLQHEYNINPTVIQSGNGIYGGGSPPIQGGGGDRTPDTIHVYTDGSPIHIEQLLQHIQQADPHQFIPFLTQQHQANSPNNHHFNNENRTSYNLHPGTGAFPGFNNNGNEAEIQVVELDPISPSTIRLVLNLPPLMVGLQGHVKLRYTDSDLNLDPDLWQSQEFATTNDILASQQLEFQLDSLKPNTLYHVQAAVVSQQLSYERKSRIHNVRTLPLQEKTTLPPIIPIEPNLSIGQVNSTSAQIIWRPFTQDELLYIDGIQLRYREIDGKVFSGTPLIHRAVTSFQLESLKPNTTYEVGIFFIPFLGQHTELQSANMIRFNTTPYTDIYDWNVSIDIEDITPWSLMIKWSGVPRPAERYVHVYRAVWRAEAARLDASSFTLPIRDGPQETNVTNLKPGTKYRIWLELYLTNGKVKNSNVRDIMTKPGKPIPEMAAGQEGKLLEASPARGDYYSSLVVVAILAALGAMCSLVLLLILLRRHRTASAPICGPTPTARTTPSLPPYDSPTYKLDLHQETMDL